MANDRQHRRGSAYTSVSDRMGVRNDPRVRHSHAPGHDASKAPGLDENAYSRVASESYLESSAIKGAKRRRRNKKIFAIAGSALAVALIAVGVAFAYVSGISTKLADGLDDSLFEALVSTDTPEDPFYVLLLGTDKSKAREASGTFGNTYRSDSIMLARVDPQDKKASIVSIPRDTMVELEGHGTNKINAARALGGAAMAVQTVSQLSGLPIAHYAEIDFNGFAKIVDALDGIDVNVPIEIDDSKAGGHISAGQQHLNGKQALILCRSRHAYDNYGPGDLFRAANQRLVLSAIANKLLQSDVATIAGSIQSLAGCVTTDMKVEEIISIATSMRGMSASKDIYTAIMPTTSQYLNGAWYEVINQADWDAMIIRMDAGKSPAAEDQVDKATGTILASAGSGEDISGNRVDINATIRIRNGSGTDGVCSDAQSVLEELGYLPRNFDLGNADNFNYKKTVVVYRDDAKKPYAKSMVKAFGLGKAMKDDGSYLFDSDFLIIIGSDWEI